MSSTVTVIERSATFKLQIASIKLRRSGVSKLKYREIYTSTQCYVMPTTNQTTQSSYSDSRLWLSYGACV